jgi:hypothetical protein
MSWIEHIIHMNLVLDKIIVSPRIHWDTYTAAPPLLAPLLHHCIHLMARLWLYFMFVYKLPMSWIEYIININLVLDKIIVSTQIHWDTYTTAIGTAAPLLLAPPLRRRIHLMARQWLYFMFVYK